jgi:hypothetical protein
MRKHLLVLALILGSIGSPAGFLVAPGWAQAPPPVPAEPDTERRTRYTGVSSVTTFPVTFDIYGDGTDFTSWVEVWVNGVNQVGNWSLVPTSGSFTTLARPLLAANLNIVFTSGQTGTVDIVGARRPRRTSQLSENQGVPARAFNQVITDLWMTLRETWDRTNDISGRAIMGVPGDQFGPLPAAAARAGQFICFGPAGQLTMCAATSGSSTIQAGNGIIFTGSSPTNIAANFAAGAGIVLTGTSPITITRAPIATRAVTGNDTSSSADCGRMILATGGLTTLTLPAASAAGAGCEIGYRNNEVYSGIGTGRGKKLANFPSDFSANNILYPGQAGKVVSDGSAWRSSVDPDRWLLPTSAELCVRQDGSDTSDGLGNGTIAADCLATIQKAVLTIGTQWDGTGYNSCAVGLYAGGTSTFSEQVSMTGQSVGCYLTFNYRGTITHTSTSNCYTGGDNGIAVFNINLGFVPIFRCNTLNSGSTAAWYCHQTCIYDITGSYQWVPGGTNDQQVFLDGQGRVTIQYSGGGLVVGDGAARSFNNMFQCDQHCSQLQVSGQIGFSASVSCNRIFAAFGGSLMNTNASYLGSCTGVTTSTVSGNSVLNTNGTTIPGGTVATTGGQVCTTKC